MIAADVLKLVQALTPLVPGAVVGVEQVMGALKGAGALTDDQVDADLLALVAEAVQAKAEADAAAAGQ